MYICDRQINPIVKSAYTKSNLSPKSNLGKGYHSRLGVCMLTMPVVAGSKR